MTISKKVTRYQERMKKWEVIDRVIDFASSTDSFNGSWIELRDAVGCSHYYPHQFANIVKSYRGFLGDLGFMVSWETQRVKHV